MNKIKINSFLQNTNVHVVYVCKKHRKYHILTIHSGVLKYYGRGLTVAFFKLGLHIALQCNYVYTTEVRCGTQHSIS